MLRANNVGGRVYTIQRLLQDLPQGLEIEKRSSIQKTKEKPQECPPAEE